MSQKAAILALMFALTSLPVFADDWVVTRLRGAVEAKADSGWQKLTRGVAIPDDRYVRTGPNGRVELVRGNESISLEPNTQIRIDDRGGPKPYTTVSQDYGTVAVEAEVRQVAHFEVRNKILAAVVKGTRFVVTAGKTDASVEVKRGHVYVEDNSNKSNVMLSVGQQASLSTGASCCQGCRCGRCR
jgi:ferric-dicitrate binding protein FerR (iron transport regulator)